MAGRFFTEKEASEYLKREKGIGFAPKTLRKMRCTCSDGPKFIKLARRVFYEQTALDEFVSSKIGPAYSSTSEYSKGVVINARVAGKTSDVGKEA
jgi:hypothetical protein